MMPKREAIAAIMQINRSARAEFLSAFSCNDLSRYLDRLSSIRWVGRTSSSPASQSAGPLNKNAPADVPFRFTSDKARA